jgi:mannose-6-phosphate isomerase-like protein (cupin superfamily)
MIDVKELFDALKDSTVVIDEKPWGYECVIDTNDFLLKFIHIDAGHRTALHYHDEKEEMNIIVNRDASDGFIVDENGAMIFGEEDGRIVHIQPGMTHRACGELDMIELTSHHPDDITRIADDYGRV